MKNLMRFTAVALVAGAVTWTTGTAWAQCADLADTTDLVCKAALACQQEIQKDSLAFGVSMQGAALAMIKGSQGGTNTKPQTYYCTSGVNVGKTCQGNNGGCKLGKTACNANADCAIALDSCVAATGCNGKGCAKTKVPCVTDGDCDGTIAGNICDILAVAPDTNECQPIPSKNLFASTIGTAQSTLLSKLVKKCAAVLPADIGVTHMSDCLIGRCTNPAGVPCNADNELTACTGGAGSCDYNGDSGTLWISNLAACVEESGDGDFNTGVLVDTMLRPFAKMTGTGSVEARAKKTSKGSPVDLLPRGLLELNGSESLVIGTIVGSDTPTQGGAVQYLGLASCSDGSEAPACLNNKDCGATTDHCVRNGRVCVGTSLNTTPTTCTSDASCASGDSCGTKVTGPIKVHKCCSNDHTLPCLSNAPCTAGGGTCGYTGCPGNILTIQETASNGSTTCLWTRQANAGNDTTSRGAINLKTGAMQTQAPILTDVFLVGYPQNGCGRCTAAHKCDSNSLNSDAKCTSAPGQLDQGCFADPAGYLGTIPNPFILTTGKLTMTAGTAPGFIAKQFCGFCGNDNRVGCQKNVDCGSTSTKCDPTCPGYGCTGFHGDPLLSQISVTGEAHEYAPNVVGLFCTGKTTSDLVNGSAGLPGPVRIVQPYILGYVFSTDK